MKIADELLILTREHYAALSLGNQCVNVAKSCDTEKIKPLCGQISANFRQDFCEHFETEEATIFAFLRAKSPQLEKLCDQLIAEHRQLYTLAENLANQSELLEEFGQLLKNHVRLESRQLFPNIERLNAAQRRCILESSTQHLGKNKS
jgi:hemerythrin-like domain-containing protein